jgi:flagellar hook-associated protein 3
MRVPNISTYFAATYRLGNLTEDLKNANEVISTQKRINEMSDDPLGLSQVLSLRNSVGNLEQIEKNVVMGKSWLEGVETSLDSVNNLILEAKADVSRLANDSVSADERQDAVARIDHIIEQVVSLGNTQVNGNYVFGGTRTDTPPLSYDKVTDQVHYTGTPTPFEIRSDRNSEVQVGRNGKETFWDTTVEINTTNNTLVFKEDNGHGSVSEKTIVAKIPSGIHTKQELTTAVRNALNDASDRHGYGVSYDVAYDTDTRQFAIQEDGSYPGYLRTRFLWDTGEEAYINDIKTSSRIDPNDVDISVLNNEALTLGTPEPAGTKPFELSWAGNGNWQVEGNPGYVLPGKITGTANLIEIDLNENGVSDITIQLDKKVQQIGDAISFEIIPHKGDHSVGHELGFSSSDMVYSPPVSDTYPVFVTDLTITTGSNDTIDFVEIHPTSGVSATLSATIGPGDYTDMNDLAQEIETGLEDASANGIDYAVSYDPETSRFNIRENGTSLDELQILWSNTTGASTTAATLGFYAQDDIITYPKSTISPVLDTFDDTNNVIEFTETHLDGTISDDIRVDIPPGDYANLDAVAAEIQTLMRDASPNKVNYAVTYDAADGFMIKGSKADIKGFDLLWRTGANAENSAAKMLGFYTAQDDVVRFSESDQDIVNLEIDGSNNKIDFTEIMPEDMGKTVSELTAAVRQKTYTSMSDLAHEVESALESASMEKANKIDYTVSWDDVTRRFSIKENGTRLEEFHLQWQTGENAPASVGGSDQSIGSLLGFSPADDLGTSLKGTAPLEWGIFNTLIDLKTYLTDNDRDGVERTIGRLEHNFDNMTSRIVDTGMKYSRLQIRETITTEVSLTLNERKSMIEDADIIEAIMKLQNIQNAYQAALSSTSQILNVSLVDYL